MNTSEILFWNVDTQNDFVLPEGKLYVTDAELLRPLWKEITEMARQKNIRVMNTADFHYPDSAEISDNPDFISTFPEHCMANTTGAEHVPETKPEDPLIFNWDKEYYGIQEMLANRNVLIRKNEFDVFAGNQNTDRILECLAPETVIVYGVTTNVCVDYAVRGLSKRVKKVMVVEDAIKELPNIPLPFEEWNKLNINMITFNELRDLLSGSGFS